MYYNVLISIKQFNSKMSFKILSQTSPLSSLFNYNNDLFDNDENNQNGIVEELQALKLVMFRVEKLMHDVIRLNQLTNNHFQQQIDDIKKNTTILNNIHQCTEQQYNTVETVIDKEKCIEQSTYIILLPEDFWERLETNQEEDVSIITKIRKKLKSIRNILKIK